MTFKIFIICSSGGHLVQEIWTSGQEMFFKGISYLQLWQPFYSTEQNHLGNFRRELYEEHFCEIILNLDQWFKEMLFKIFLNYSSGSPSVHRSGTI